MTDMWLPRLHLLAQVAIVCVCGALIGTGHDSTISDLFCAGAGGLLATTSYTALTKGKTPTETTK
jgi:hypothetical protein